MIKLSNVFSLFLLTISFSSCAILGSIFNGGQKPANVKKNNTFEVFCNVEGAKIEVLDKPTKENFEATNTKRGNEYYSTNTYNKLRKGRTKLLISQDGYIPDTIKIKRAPRPGVLIFDICLLTPYSPFLDLLSPDFYKISKKSRIHHVYLSPTQDFMRLKYNEISKKSDVAVFDNFIMEFPNSECLTAAKSRRDSIIKLNQELKANYSKAISTNNQTDIREFLRNYQTENLKHPDLISNETKDLLPAANRLFYKNIFTQLSSLQDELEQSNFIEKTILDLNQVGIKFNNTKEFILSILNSAGEKNGEIQLYGQKITSDYLMTWFSDFKPYKDEKADIEQSKLILSTVDAEKITYHDGKITSISGLKNGNLLFRIFFSKDINPLFTPDYIKYVKDRDEKSYAEAKEQGIESKAGFRFDNILLHVFLEEKMNEEDESKNIRFAEYYCPEYGSGGSIKKRIKLNYSYGKVMQTLISWNYNAERAIIDAREAKYLKVLSESRNTLYSIILDLNSLKLVDAPTYIEDIDYYSDFYKLIEKCEKWKIEVDERYFLESNSGLPWDENENSGQGKSEKTTNFCFQDEYNGYRYEIKLYNKENGEGKVVYNLYKRDVLTKTVTGKWEEKYISLGDATKIVCSMDGGLNMEFYLRKYMNGAWQDLQEMEGAQRTWSYCSQ